MVQLVPWGALMSFYVHQAELRALCGPVHGNSNIYGKKKDINLIFFPGKQLEVLLMGQLVKCLYINNTWVSVVLVFTCINLPECSVQRTKYLFSRRKSLFSLN